MAQRLLVVLCVQFLFLASAFGATPSPLFPHEGKPIVIVRIEGADDQGEAAVRSLLEIEPGFLFSSTDVSRALRRIYSLGRFREIGVRVEPIADALELVVRVVELERLGELRLEGDVDEGVQAELKALVLPGQPYEPALLEHLTKRCEKAWQQVGYFGAACTAKDEPSERRRNRRDVVLRSERGAPTTIAEIVFDGSVRPPDWHLQNEISLAKGGPLIEKQLKADERALRLAYFKRGFLNAEVTAEAQRTGERAVVRFTVASGPRISLKVRGNSRFKDRALLDLVPRQKDEPLGRDVLDAWRRAVVAKYQGRGFAFVKVTVKSFYEAPRHIVHHLLHIEEGERASIEKLSFPGAEHFKEDRLRDETIAFVNLRLDASPLSGDINPNAVRALQDGSVGIPARSHIVPPRFEHWLFRDDPNKVLLPDAYRQAMEQIRKLYLEQGYTEVEVGPMTVTRKPLPSLGGAVAASGVPERTELEVLIPIKEGPRSLVSVLSFGGTQALSSEALLGLAKISPGEPFSELLVEETRNAIQKELGRRGYLYAHVEPAISFTPDRTAAEIRYNIVDGPQVMVGRILIQGNEEVDEKVIGDRIALLPQEPYSPDLARSTKDELTKLETFTSTQVGITDPEVPAEQKDVLVKLVERDTFRSIDAGFGFSTTQGVRGFVEIGHKNLFQRGHQLVARLQLNRQVAFVPLFYNTYWDDMALRYSKHGGFSRDFWAFISESIERLVRLSWRMPRTLKLPGQPQVYSEATNERLNTIPFSLDSGVFLVGVDLIPVNHLGLVLETSAAVNYLRCFPIQIDARGASTTTPSPSPPSGTSSCDPSTLQRVTALASGLFFNWKMGPTLLVDFRDDKLNPRSGFLGVVKADMVIGRQIPTDQDRDLPANTNYGFIKAEVQATGYLPIGKRSSLVFSATAGNIFRAFGEETLLRAQLNERYFVGGRNTLRGYIDRGLLPEDACVVPSEAVPCDKPQNRVVYDPARSPPIVPGAFKLVAKAEFRFPVVSDLMAGIFVDAGNLYFDAANFTPVALRWNFGAGIRYQTGVGAIAVDVGLNPFFRPERGETIFAYPYIYFGLF